MNLVIWRERGGDGGEETWVIRMGSEKSPPEDDPSEVWPGRSFLVGGGPSRPGLVDDCLTSSDRLRSGGFDGPDFDPL